jgi:hypothetical protein
MNHQRFLKTHIALPVFHEACYLVINRAPQRFLLVLMLQSLGRLLDFGGAHSLMQVCSPLKIAVPAGTYHLLQTIYWTVS